MHFQILKLILWPRKDLPPRIVEFEPGVVNVISGASKTGKSAVIPIIDYCLGADKCTIPVGVIRENCSWFGVLVETLEGQKLLARREPGDQQTTGDMFVLEGPEVGVPARIREKNTNADTVKAMLNRLAGLSGLGFDPSGENPYASRPSFRDLMAFTFQPQNIVANPDVMFFKADTADHREKLKTIFPYVLRAIDGAVLQARWELDRLQRALRQKEAELRSLEQAATAWRREAQAWVRQAIELGLLPVEEVPRDWSAIVDLLRSLPELDATSARPSLEGVEAALTHLEELRRQEEVAAAELTEHRQRLNEIRRLMESSEAYGGALLIQRDRLSLSNWLREQVSEAGENEPINSLGPEDKDALNSLCSALEGMEVRLRSHPSLSGTLDKEVVRLRANAETALSQLNQTRREIANLEQASEETKEAAQRFDRIERFLGRVEQALKLYDEADQSSGVREAIAGLRERIGDLQKIVSEVEIRRRTENAIDQLQATTSRLIPQLDAEWPDAPIRLTIPDLTVKVIRGTRDDYLWEIGSGANWLAYHVALTLALQQFFLDDVNHPVPAFLVFDQPSQVYFPKRLAREEDEADDSLAALKDEDIAAVRKVFALLSNEVGRHRGRLQVIVLDHADDSVWGALQHVVLIEEWRGTKLVPHEWQQ